MTQQELHEFLTKFYSDYFSGNAPLGIDIRKNNFYEKSVSNELFEKRYQEMLRVQNESPAHQKKPSYVNAIKRVVFRYMKLGLLVSEPEYACFKEKFEKGRKTAKKLISRAARLDSAALWDYSENHDTFSLDDFLSIKSCMNSLCSENAVSVISTVYVPSKIRNKLKDIIPHDPKDEYPLARKLKRHFILHIGLTNTGKTYHSIERLKQVSSGVYLGPLRLLALEVQENLNESGVPCNLVTGEEEDMVAGANHTSSTVEKLDINKKYDVAVIDECQLLSDGERGCSWARAILGVQAEEIHLAMAPEGESICIKMIESCGDTYEVQRHERSTKLTFLNSRYRIPNSIQQGDALIVFSRKEALYLGEYLSKMGIPTSVIYGALPYKSRKKQLQRFLSGETKVVVSTDAIGMGLNLPIRRIIFCSSEKFDGVETRFLRPPEVKQIAGRAGRMGMYPEGFVMAIGDPWVIENGLNTPNETINKAYIGFSDTVASLDGDIIDILKIWRTMSTLNMYRKTQIDRYITLDNIIRPLFKGRRAPSKEEELKMLNIPFDEKNPTVLNLWIEYVKTYLEGGKIEFPKIKATKLQQWETAYKCLDLYYSFSKNFGYKIDFEKLNGSKNRVTKNINRLLIASLECNVQKKILKEA